jgi:3-hydroxyisobutyrate dehydrogenase
LCHTNYRVCTDLFVRVVASAGSIVTMLPSTNEVNIVYRQDGGIISGLNSLSEHERQTTFCIDSTTLDVQSAIDVATSVKNMGAEMVDAPVSGGTVTCSRLHSLILTSTISGVAGAKAGTLTFLVGGTEAGFNRAKTMLVDMGARIVHVGPSGAGLAAKIVNNMILGVQQFAVAEGMLLGKQLGLDPAVLADVVNSSTGACWSSSVNNPAPGALKGTGKTPPCENGYQGGFATALMLKVLLSHCNQVCLHPDNIIPLL